MTDKPIFQINYDEENDVYKYIINEIDNKEFLAFLSFLKMCVRKFDDDSYEIMLLKNDKGDED